MGNVLLVLGIIILIAAIVSPLSIIIGGVIGAAMIIAGIILRKKNTNSKVLLTVGFVRNQSEVFVR